MALSPGETKAEYQDESDFPGCQQELVRINGNAEQPVSSTSGTPQKESQLKGRKRKRSLGEESSHFLELQRQSQTLFVSSAGEDAPVAEDAPIQKSASESRNNKINPIRHWVQEGHWPSGYFVEDDIIMDPPLTRKRSTTSRHGASSSGEQQREAKSAPYSNPRYQTVLETKGSFMKNAHVGITDESRMFIKRLLDTDQTVPQDSLFRDDIFKTVCDRIQGENEPRVIRDIGQLIVPSAEILAFFGAGNLEHLVETRLLGWLRDSAFTDDQLKKLAPFIGDWDETSFFMATDTIHFPFLACEVKCGDVALDIADRQNAHSMTLAVRGVVELYRLVKRENGLHREILAFSISHDYRAVRIYGHYALIEGGKTTFYRHLIHEFSFIVLDGRERWTAYKFTKSVYDIWMPIHLERIISAVDQIPDDLNFNASQSSSQFSNSG